MHLAQLMLIVGEAEQAALAEHDVEVERLAQALPQLEGMLVEVRALVPEIVRAHDGGVATGVAAADPALLEHGDVADAMLLGEVVGGGETVAAAADDDHVVFRAGLRAAPGRRPVAMMGQGVAGEAEDRVAGFHRRVRPGVGGAAWWQRCLRRSSIAAWRDPIAHAPPGAPRGDGVLCRIRDSKAICRPRMR